jgi:hypothetical protein
MLISTFYARFLLICAFYADQANYKNSAFNACHQVNAVSCLSARLMLSSRTIRHVSCLSLCSKLEIALSRNDHFFGNGLSSSSFLFPPNVKHDVLDLSVLCKPSGIVSNSSENLTDRKRDLIIFSEY